MQVMIVVITADSVMPECLDSIKATGCPYHINVQTPTIEDSHPLVAMTKNCAANRMAAREYVLATSNADAFLLVDSDIVLPAGAVEEFIKQSKTGKHIIGGWYRIRNNPQGKYVAGRYVADNTFFHFTSVQPSLIKTDLVGLGCTFMMRKVMEELYFPPGGDKWCHDRNGNQSILEDCAEFSNLANEKGYELWMDGSVVCKHLERGSEATEAA